MRKLVLTCLGIASLITATNAQTLFTFGNTPVSKEDFLRVYQKNSINKQPDFSEPALKEYLDLYSLFRMKVKEAELQKLDTLSSIQYELDNYRKQLAKNYLTDDQVINKLIKEAYDRMKEEVHVAHILIMVNQMANGADTVAAYKKIDSLYNAISKGKAEFGAMASAFSDDRGTKPTGGDLGYLTALQTVYPFENVIYNTPVGKISKPFRTQFGYHIVKVMDRRAAKGEVKIAQILVAIQKSKGAEGEQAAQKRADSVMAMLKQGKSFTELVKKYSDDKYSINDDGVLAPIGVGKVAPEFEDAAFGLKKTGDITQVRTDFGFHIIKLIDKYPLKPFDSLQSFIKRKVDNDSRAQVARDLFYDKMKQKNGFKEYTANFDEVVQRMMKLPDTGKNANTFKASDFSTMTKPLFELDKRAYLQSDFISYAEELTRGRLMGPKNAVMRDIYNMYVKTIVNDIEEHRLVDEYPEFKNLMEEYRDGIMLFELMDRNVWGKASKDTAGLKAFYEKNKSKYQWEPGFTGSVYKFKSEKVMKEGLKLLGQKGVKDEDVIKKLNNDSMPDAVTIQRGHYEFSKFKEVPQASITSKKVTDPKKNEDGTYTVVRVDEVYNAPTQKSLDDARGYVVAEYQDYLEKTWNEQMRQKYPVKVENTVFKSMVK
jgi:peptidyl-prolyl cis-trans isomerase SurA